MYTPEKIGKALARVKKSADRYNAHIVMSRDISRTDREILTKTGWLIEIIQGWYLLTRPDVIPGDSVAWYSNFWDFLRIYLNDRFGKAYCLSAESSLVLHLGNTLTPKQVVVITKEGGTVQNLPFDTSVLIYADPKNFPTDDVVDHQGLRIMSLPLALCKVSPTYFQKSSDNIEIAIRLLRKADSVLRIILKHNLKSAADRIAGSFAFFGMTTEAENIKDVCAMVGMPVNPNVSFKKTTAHLQAQRLTSPYAGRIALMWDKFRQPIIDLFPKEMGLPTNPQQYLQRVEELYVYDAYNSLSIEGYHVNEELIRCVQNKKWNPDLHPEDRNSRNALAARGYYEAFQSVKKSLTKILNGQSPGVCVEKDLSVWYQNLFSPCVQANIIQPEALFGYRHDRVFIRNSRHSPPPFEAVLDAMETFFHCMKNEESASVRAVLGHYVFVFIHPYMDGNGRTARFILNTMLASGGYPWSVVEVKRRAEYINALETTHITSDIKPFTRFIIDEMNLSKKF